MLKASELSKKFGGLQALSRFSLQVTEGEIVGIIGPNGAGKTTLFNLLGGSLSLTGGQISFQGRDVTRLRSHEIARLGISRTYQKVSIFQNLTTLENVVVGRHHRINTGIFSNMCCLPASRRREKEAWSRARELLEFLGLAESAEVEGGILSYGNQKLLSLGIALAADPHLLLLDEPAAGMNNRETSFLMSLIRRLKQEGLTIMIVEHDMKVIMDLCDRIAVLNFGMKIAEGPPSEISQDEKVIEVYLGQGEYDA